jgi:pseudouridine-5'-phosphate glycosidase
MRYRSDQKRAHLGWSAALTGDILMNNAPLLRVHPEVAEAIEHGGPVVALESQLIAHGLPWPLNLETARAAEESVRSEGAVPATIAVCRGCPMIGLTEEQMEELATGDSVLKASRRDLPVAVAQKVTAATTVAATMYLAHRAGIRFLATGGTGGVHRGNSHRWDISADLLEIARTPVAVVCAGAKSILDISRTLEVLETHGVLVVGYRTDDFPAFFVQSSGEPVNARVDTPESAAALIQAHWDLGGAGLLMAQPVLADVALEQNEFESALEQVEREAVYAGVRGKELTPFLLTNLAEVTQGKTLRANRALVISNARLAAQIAGAYSAMDCSDCTLDRPE